MLSPRRCRIRIEGHTDNVPIRNSQFSDNWELSTARSAELVRLLINKYGFAAERRSAAGYAEYHPVASNDSPETRAQNRRVENASHHKALVASVGLSDLLCRMAAIGHGFPEMRQVNFLDEPGFAILRDECPSTSEFDWARFTFELEGYLEEVRRLVRQLYRPS